MKFDLQFYSCMDLITPTQAEGGLASFWFDFLSERSKSLNKFGPFVSSLQELKLGPWNSSHQYLCLLSNKHIPWEYRSTRPYLHRVLGPSLDPTLYSDVKKKKATLNFANISSTEDQIFMKLDT